MSEAKVTLREITGENLRSVLALSVTEEQKKVYSRSNAYSIAEGHHPPDDDPVWMRAIYAGEGPVGFITIQKVDEAACPWSIVSVRASRV